MTDIYSFTYEYGNGDRYSGQVYASDGTYSVGQEIFLVIPNITGNQGKYTITSVSNVDSAHYAAYEGYVYTNVYEDAVTSTGELGYSAVSGHAAGYATGYSGLGSESGYAYGDLMVRFTPYYQADLISPFSLTSEYDYVYGLGHGGNDTVVGAFTDLLQNDYVDGGEAIDTLIINGDSEYLVEVYAGNGINQLNIPGTEVYNFENFDFSGFTTNVNFYGAAGTNNTFLGGSGTDTVDYTGLGAKITLKAQGIIEKDSGGQDTVRAETIIGDVGFANAIDASSSSSTPIIVDLSSESLTVVGLPSGDADFTVINFVDVTGSQLADTITGDDQNNTFNGQAGDDSFFGSGGSDIIIGGDDLDTVDYSQLEAQITLKAQGIIEKEGIGSDTVQVETIIGNSKFKNVIDSSLSSTTPIIVNLSENSLNVAGLPSGNATFTVANFVDVIGTQTGDTIKGNGDDNTLDGQAGDDEFVGTDGSDTIIGGDDLDTVDYSQLDTKITLKAEGIIEKEGIGTDTVQVEAIIGNGNFKNVIDASFSSTTPITVDLSFESLTVAGLPSGDTTFTVKNFVDVTGSQLADTITGNGQNNTFNGQAGDDSFVGSGGSDIIIGGDDIDTIDYSQLDTKITLKAQGIIEKEGIGTDTVQVEAIIGNGNFKNVIDSSLSSTTPIIVNLSENSLNVAGLPSGNATFTVANFVDVIGTQTGDTIKGNGDDNTLDGQAGDDEFVGSDGSDTIIGGGGSDSLDYTSLTSKITLKALGIIDKGELGIDTVQVETIISNSEYVNVIDASDSTNKSINVDLAANLLTVTDLGSFNVFNFKDVTGTSLADSITGNDSDNYLDGKSGNDILIGGIGNDILIGGVGADTLQGDVGIDTASYVFASAGISVNLTTGKGTLNGSIVPRMIS